MALETSRYLLYDESLLEMTAQVTRALERQLRFSKWRSYVVGIQYFDRFRVFEGGLIRVFEHLVLVMKLKSRVLLDAASIK